MGNSKAHGMTYSHRNLFVGIRSEQVSAGLSGVFLEGKISDSSRTFDLFLSRVWVLADPGVAGPFVGKGAVFRLVGVVIVVRPVGP
jgi:hypothetical protein